MSQEEKNSPKDQNSYGQIVKSSSIMGGAAGINMLLSMLRVKFAAIFIGAAGVGLLASFTALQNMIGILAGLGLQSSAVREIAGAYSRDDYEAVGRIILTLRRMCWLTGFMGMLSMMLLSSWLSQLVFSKQDYSLDIAVLGVAILLANISGGQKALIQGTRRIGDLARVNIIAAIVGTTSAIVLYWALGLRGIIPTILMIAATQLFFSWWYARRIHISKVILTWSETFNQASDMVRLGIAMMFSGLLASTVSLITISLVTQQEGISATGFYSAAFALSGLFVGFVLQAMGADYYPRLTGVTHAPEQMTKLVNEQTEVGLLLALPGLLATLIFAPWAMHIFYSAEFLPAVELLQWFLFGCLGRVISWPLGYVILALGKGRWYLLTESTFSLLHLMLIYIGLSLYGVLGVAFAFFIMYLIYIVAVSAVCRHLIAFRWSHSSLREIIFSSLAFAITLMMCKFLPIIHSLWIGSVIVIVVGIISVRGLAIRLGKDHRLVQMMKHIPGSKFILPHF